METIWQQAGPFVGAFLGSCCGSLALVGGLILLAFVFSRKAPQLPPRPPPPPTVGPMGPL